MELKAGSFFYYFIFGCIGSAVLSRLCLLAESKGFFLVAVPRILIAMAFLVVEPGLWVQGFQWLWPWAELFGSMWNLPGPGIEPIWVPCIDRQTLTNCTTSEIPKSWPFEKVNKINKSLARFIKKNGLGEGGRNSTATCVKQVCQCHFSSIICSFCISSRSGNSHNI